MLLTDDQRKALEAIVSDHAEGDGFVFGTLIEVLNSLGMIDEVIDEQNADGLAALAQLLLLIHENPAPCPHLTGRTTQWCALGQTTAEADRALMKIGAALWEDGVASAIEVMAEAGRTLGGSTITDRARELAQEATGE